MDSIQQQLAEERQMRLDAEHRLDEVSRRTAELEEMLFTSEDYSKAKRSRFSAAPWESRQQVSERKGLSSISSGAVQQTAKYISRKDFLEHCFQGNRGQIDQILSRKAIKKPSSIPDSEWNYAIVFSNPDFGEDPPVSIDLSTALDQFDSCFRGELDRHDGFVQSVNKKCEKEAFYNSFLNLPDSNQLYPDYSELAENQKLLTKGKHLVQEGGRWLMLQETATDYSTLIRNIVQTKLSLHIGLKAKLLLSKDGRYIYMLVSADEQDLANEAQRTNYNLQLEIAASDIQSIEPCDEKMRLLRLLKKPKYIHAKLKEMSGVFKNATFEREEEDEIEEELYEPEGVSAEAWDNYRDFLDLVKQGMNALKASEVSDDKKYSYFHAVIKNAVSQVNERRPAGTLYNLWDRLEIQGYIGAYSNFVKRMDRAKKVDTVAHYWRTYPQSPEGDRSIFRKVDRLKLTYTMILSQIDLHKLDTLDLIVTHFPLHNQTDLVGYNIQAVPQQIDSSLHQVVMTTEVSRGVLSTWRTNDVMEAPITDIRNYFGEKVALYFWFLYSYTRWLVILGVVGLVISIVGLHDLDRVQSNYLHIAFCLCTVVWSTAFMVRWRQHQVIKSVEWGQIDFEEDETTRPQFQGETQRSPVTDANDSLQTDRAARLKYVLLGIVITNATIVCGGVLVYVLLYLRLLAMERKMFVIYDYDCAADLFGLLTAVQIEVFNFLYYKVSVRLTDLENYKTQSQYENSLIIKTYLFEFFNSYNSIIYIAFFKSQVEGCLLVEDDQGNLKEDCMYELRTQLAWIFIIHVLMNLFNTLRPLVVEWWEKRKRPISQEDEAPSLQSNLDIEMKKDEFLVRGLDGTFSEYLELMVQFGYNTLFAVAFPLAPFLALLSNLVEIVVDRFKILHLYRRPTPLGAKTIGKWADVLESLTLISILTNSAILCFTLRAFDDWQIFEQNAFMPFVLLSATMLLARQVVKFLLAEIPEHYAQIIKRHERVVDQLIKGFEPNKKTYEESREWLVLRISDS
jgi:hypothetical protein